MPVILLSAWVLFIAAFFITKMLFPDVGTGVRRVKDIKDERFYGDDGYDEYGFTALGFHRNGTRYDNYGYDRYGYDVNGNPRPEKPEREYTDPGETPLAPKHVRMRAIAIIMAVITVVLVGITVLDYVRNSTCLFGHTYIETDCKEPIKCGDCDLTFGEPIGHKWMKADCERPERCRFCLADKEGSRPLGHTTDNGLCTRCDKKIG